MDDGWMDKWAGGFFALCTHCAFPLLLLPPYSLLRTCYHLLEGPTASACPWTDLPSASRPMRPPLHHNLSSRSPCPPSKPLFSRFYFTFCLYDLSFSLFTTTFSLKPLQPRIEQPLVVLDPWVGLFFFFLDTLPCGRQHHTHHPLLFFNIHSSFSTLRGFFLPSRRNTPYLT